MTLLGRWWGHSRFPVGLGHSRHGDVFPVYAVEPPPAYSFATAYTDNVLGVMPGWDAEEESITRGSALVAWSWARLVAPSVASQYGLTARDPSDGPLLTTGTPWRAIHGPSCGMAKALALLQYLVPGLSYKGDQAVTGSIHLGGRIGSVT
jgi:hypothetical protein